MAELQSWKQKRARVEGSISRIKEYAGTISENTDIVDISTRLQKLKEAFQEFCIYDDKISLLPNESSNFAIVEEIYWQIEATLQRELNHRTHSTNHHVLAERTASQPASEPRLPRLTIPAFDGSYIDWPSFQDLFTTTVHTNSTLNNVQKFQYLKGLLKGEALMQIRHILVTESNYDTAWNRLVERYDRKKQIINDFIKTFVDQPSISQANASNLRRLSDTSDEIIRGLEALGHEAQARDPWIIYMLLQKTDGDTRQLCAQHTSDKTFPSFQDFIKFVNNRCDALEAYNANLTQNSSHTEKAQAALRTHFNSSRAKCPKCSSNHPLFKCAKFKALDTPTRRKLVLQHNLCFNCLDRGHQTTACRSSFRCHYCNEKHHSALHQHTQMQCHHSTAYASNRAGNTPTINKSNNQQNSAVNSRLYPTLSTTSFDTSYNSSQGRQSSLDPTSIPYTPNSNASLNNATPNSITVREEDHITREHSSATAGPYSSKPAKNLHCHQINHQHPLHSHNSLTKLPVTLLPTAIVFVRHGQGVLQPCRALLDSASMATFITEACVQRLRLPRTNHRSSVNGLSSVEVTTTRGEVTLHLVPENSESLQIQAFVLKKLTSAMPPVDISTDFWPYIHQVKLADELFHRSSEIDILIGADHFFTVIQDGQIRHPSGAPILQNTIFGWVVSGQHNTIQSIHKVDNFHITINRNIDEVLKQFWELENIPSSSNYFTDEEILCEEHFTKHTYVDKEGRFVVRLPFKEPAEKLGNSRRTAISCFLSLERRLRKNPQLYKEYREFIHEYQTLEHMKEIPSHLITINDNEVQGFYLPHHPVVKQASSTTKLRVVFNASRKTTSNTSLNEILGVGPTIQRELFSLILNFRRYKVAISADIAKMYRQIKMNALDWNYQRIVWRDDPSTRIKDYWLTTVTYGTSSAPFLATRALIQIANECAATDPNLANVIKNHFYMDDLLSGANNPEEATDLRKRLEEQLNRRGFELRKWKGSSEEFIKDVPLWKRDPGCIQFSEENTKILGLSWNPKADCFVFNASLNRNGPLTKRNILAESAKIFDPLGLLSPATIAIKILYQQLWLEKLGWDDVLPESLTKKWQTFENEFSKFEEMQVQRWLNSTQFQNCQLHGLCDASEAAYAAVIYCRSMENGHIKTNIVAAKTRVTPIKQQSLPRLELCGALLLARLFVSVLAALDNPNTQCFAWTDSSIVLSWLNSQPRRWKAFIANRTSEILSTLPINKWRHVTSNDNPADLASRGISPQSLIKSVIWWQGPYWMSKLENTWPTQASPQMSKAAEQEERPRKVHTLQAALASSPWDHITNIISSFPRIIRFMSYWRRYMFKLKHKTFLRLGRASTPPVYDNYLSTKELHQTTTICIKWVQQTTFKEDLKCLSSIKILSSKSKIVALSPFLDEAGLLRVGGRIQHAACQYNTKHPIILPKQHIVTSLIVQQYHLQYLHPGPTLLLSIIRQQYWIIGGRSTIRQYIHKCIPCFRQRRTTHQQFMASLPEPRVRPSRPFSQCGIDYAGPIRIRLHKGRGAKLSKGYIALFVCFSTKAIHVELVSDLTSDAFIAALKRFTARRGIPSAIYSDNATNFVGTKRKLSELYKLVLSKSYNELISSFLSQKQTVWHFIPPASPHFGGIWESGVKAVKTHMRRVIGDTPLTFEEMATLLTQIEGILNSRPLTAISDDDISSLDALTPAHFLVGTALTALPERNFNDLNPPYLTRWQQVQKMTQSFWKQWSTQYLHSLNQRPKWRYAASNLAVGDVVLIHEENLPPSAWLLGKITAVHPGLDNLVRAVTIKTSHGELKRPIIKISKLPID